MPLIVKTNILQNEDVLIRDMGVIIPKNGGFDTFGGSNRLEEARHSFNLRTFSTDQKFGTDGSTLILNDGVDDISFEDAGSFLDEIPNVRTNFWSGRNPLVTDDETLGYVKGSRWINIATQTPYICVSATANNAVWKKFAQGTGGGGTGFGIVLAFGDNGSVKNKFANFCGTSYESHNTSYIMPADGKIITAGVGVEREEDNSTIIQIIKNPTYGGSGVHSGGIQVGIDLETDGVNRINMFEDLTGFNFSKMDKIAVYLKQGTLGQQGTAKEPAISLYVSFD